MKKIVFLFSFIIFSFLFSLSFNFSFGQKEELNSSEDTVNSCSLSFFEILGENKIVLGEDLSLQLVLKNDFPDGWPINLEKKIEEQIPFSLDNAKISYSLYKGTKLIKKENQAIFTFSPQQVGQYLLKISLEKWDCKLTFEEWIHVYQEAITIIGKVNPKLLDPYIVLFDKENIFINIIELKKTENSSIFRKSLKKIKKGQNIILMSESVDATLQDLVKLVEDSDLSLVKKNIIFVNGMNRNLLKRIVSKYRWYLDADTIYTTDKQNFINLIASLSNKENLAESEYLSLFSLSETKSPAYLILSSVVDKLIYNGFPISLIALLLTISLAVLAVTIFRQVIGFDVFGSYSPLMLGLAIHILWFQLSGVLLAFAFLATIFVRLFTKKVYLLYSAKISLLISLYFLWIFVGLSYFYWFLSSFLDFALFANMFVVFPMLLIIFVSEKMFYEGFSFLNKGWRVSIIEFSLVSFIVFLIIHSVVIQNFMLSYPEVIIVVILLIVLVGRFSGLQLLEYLRFFPLMKDEDKEEEE